MIIDASVILAAFFPDEQQAEAQAVIGDYAAGRIALVAPSLLVYEVTNAIWQATRRGRITNEQAEAIMQAFEEVAIPLEPVAWRPMMSLARQFGRSAYDAAYLALAQEKGNLSSPGISVYTMPSRHRSAQAQTSCCVRSRPNTSSSIIV